MRDWGASLSENERRGWEQVEASGEEDHSIRTKRGKR